MNDIYFSILFLFYKLRKNKLTNFLYCTFNLNLRFSCSFLSKLIREDKIEILK